MKLDTSKIKPRFSFKTRKCQPVSERKGLNKLSHPEAKAISQNQYLNTLKKEIYEIGLAVLFFILSPVILASRIDEYLDRLK